MSQEAQKPELSPRVRVLIVDDSAFMRNAVSDLLSEDGGLEVVGTARDGARALAMIEKLRPDVVTLDVEMPGLDGLATLAKIMETRPTAVVMLSGYTLEGAEHTITALALGAVDFVAKPSGPLSLDIRLVQGELTAKIRAAASAKVGRMVSRGLRAPCLLPSVSRSTRKTGFSVVVIGSSTGGPKALYEVVPALPANMDAALVIVQHMPPGFTRSLADRLNEVSAIGIKEASEGDVLQPGTGLVAPGGRHLTFDSQGVVHLTDDPPVHGVRPSVDVTLNSMVKHFGSRLLSVILTGMGSDGAAGCVAVKAAGGMVLVESESTCVVYGMPASVVRAGAADSILPLQDIAGAITQTLQTLG